MFDIFIFIVQVLESMICVYISYQLLDRKLTFKKAILIGVVLGSFWNLSHFIGLGVFKNLLIYRILMIFMIYIVSRRPNILKVVLSVFVTSNLTLMIEYTIISLFLMSQNIPVQSYINNSFIYVTVSIIYCAFDYVFYIILKKYNLSLFDSNQNYFSLDRTFSQGSNRLIRIKEILNNNNLLVIIFITQMTLITYYFYSREYFMVFHSEKNTFYLEYQTIFLSIVILVLNVMTLFMAKKLEKDREEKYKNRINKIEYAQIEKENSIIRQYKHDLNNHFMLLCGLVEEKKYEEVHNYLVKYHEDMNSKTLPVKTGLDELDVLLYSKINKALQNNIKIDYKCSANIQCNKDHIIDFIAIISNVLDNAIEASQKAEKKFIGIYINEGIVRYFFTIKNTFASRKIEEPDILLKEGFSTKGSGRGLGLKIVNRLVKKYDGNIEFNNDDKFFEIKVILPKHELERY